MNVEAYRFFREHAGYIVGHAAERAAGLARAEETSKRLGFVFEWEDEQEPWDGCEPLPADCDLLCCTVSYRGEVRGSLGMVAVRFRDPYIRVVEAELAAELVSELEDEQERDPSNALAAGW